MYEWERIVAIQFQQVLCLPGNCEECWSCPPFCGVLDCFSLDCFISLSFITGLVHVLKLFPKSLYFLWHFCTGFSSMSHFLNYWYNC